MQVTIFKNLHNCIPQETSLEHIFQIIQTSEKLKEMTEDARRFYTEGDKEAGDMIKKRKLPAFAPAAIMYGGKGREILISLTGICFFDIDHLSDVEMKDVSQIIKEDKHTLMLSRSVSGHGLHFLVIYSLKHDEHFQIGLTPNKINNIYCSVFKTLAKRYKGILNVPIDKSGMNAERLCLVSYDADIYLNYSSKPFILKYVHQQSGHYPKLYELISD